MIVYLAGSIEGIPFEQAKEWRATATSFFEKHGIKTLDPTRRKQFHDQPYSFDLAKKIVRLDYNDIFRSDVVLLNLKDRGAGRAWGSICEMVTASNQGRAVVCLIEEGFTHPFLEVYCTETHHTLEDAMKATLAYGV